jgi:hypothetical protein
MNKVKACIEGIELQNAKAECERLFNVLMLWPQNVNNHLAVKYALDRYWDCIKKTYSLEDE